MQVVLGRTVLSNDVVRDAEMAVQEAKMRWWQRAGGSSCVAAA